MRREIELRRRLRSLRALGQAVGAMKSLAAHHFREARAGIEPARAYREGLERLLAWIGAPLPVTSGPVGLLVIGAELGLCGSYNGQVVAAAERRRGDLGAGPTFSVGRRATALLARRGAGVTKSYDAPTSTAGIAGLLLRLAEDVLTTYVRGGLSSFEILSSRFAGVGIARPTSVRLLPFETTRVTPAPRVRYVAAEHCSSVVAREVLYIRLHDLLLDALASEHGARLVATQSAEKWLEDHAEQVRRALAATRREASTQEVIEIAVGARARGAGGVR